MFLHNWRGRAQALALAAAGVALVAVTVAAQPEQQERGARMRAPMPFARLNLTADQQTRVKAIFEEQRSARQAERDALRAAHDELHKAIFSSAAPDSGQVDALVARIAELEADALRARVAAQVKVASILSDDQRQQLATTPPRHGGARGRGPGRGPGGGPIGPGF